MILWRGQAFPSAFRPRKSSSSARAHTRSAQASNVSSSGPLATSSSQRRGRAGSRAARAGGGGDGLRAVPGLAGVVVVLDLLEPATTPAGHVAGATPRHEPDRV